MLHIPGKKEFEETRIGIMFPFHWGSYMFYFLLLTAYVPFGRTIVEVVTDVTDTFGIVSLEPKGTTSGLSSMAASSNATIAAYSGGNFTAASQAADILKPDDYWKFWTYQLRLTLELDSALVGPLVIAVWAEFAFGAVMPWIAYVRMKFMIRWRGYRLSRCASLVARLSCCCCDGRDGTETLTEAIFDGCDPVHSEQVGRGSYSGLAKRIGQALGTEEAPVHVELITGTWEDPAVLFDKKMNKTRRRLDRERARHRISFALAASFAEDGRPRATVGAKTSCSPAEKDNDLTGQAVNQEALGASLRADYEAANALYLESQLPVLDLTTEYLQLVQQFAYVTLFSVLWALAPLMNLSRLVWEANGAFQSSLTNLA